MPRPALRYPVSVDPLADLYLLSPWSLAEMARRFGLSRSNLMGVLRGGRTVSEATLRHLLAWSGLQAVDGELRLLPGLHVWRIASSRQLEAFARLPSELQPQDDWDLLGEADRPQREWVHVLGRVGDGVRVLLSLRPDFYPLLRDQRPGLGRPQRLTRFAQGNTYDDLAAQLGGNRLYLLPEQEACLFVRASLDEGSKEMAALEDWARWLRQALRMDTSPWLLARTEDRGAESSGDAVDPQACRRAWAALSHRLDLGDAHPEVCEVPVFPLGPLRHYPLGMVRLDRHFLGDTLLAYGKAQRLRLYKDADTRTLWLVLLERETTCGLPDAVPAGRTDQLALLQEGARLVVGPVASPAQKLLGRVLSRLQPVGGCWNRRS